MTPTTDAPNPGADDTPAPVASAPNRAPTRATKLFPAVWRWHFYAGLLSIPVIVLLCLSGIVYLFKPQIDDLAWGGMRSVTPQAQVMSFAEQQRAALAAFPGASVTQVAPPPADDRATEFDLTLSDGASRRVYVDPYTARVTGDRNPANSLTSLALELHGMLLTNRFLDEGGMWGDRIIELAASWSLVLVVTGVYLWWPRGRRRKRDALIPRWNANSQRMRWRDLHAVTGVLFSFVTLFFLITGLAWAGIWGSKVWTPLAVKLGASYPEGTYDGASSGKVADLVEHGKAGWAAGELSLAPSQMPSLTTGAKAQAPAATGPSGGSATDAGGGASAGKPGHAGHEGHLSSAGLSDLTAARPDVSVKGGGDGHTGHAHADTITWDPTKGAPIDAIVGRAQRLGFKPGYTITYPGDATGSYSVFQFADADVLPNQSSTDEAVAYLDQYTALPIKQYAFSEFGPLAKATDFGIAVHEGREWGIWSQLLSLVGSLALLLSCATAIVMWRKRKPKGLGAPRRQPDRRFGAGVVAITLVLGAMFPLLGASIIVLLLLDQVVTRVPPLARALGAG
ncbi:MAG: PepSY domain-containing protein [Patulibacter minatonensis]